MSVKTVGGIDLIQWKRRLTWPGDDEVRCGKDEKAVYDCLIIDGDFIKTALAQSLNRKFESDTPKDCQVEPKRRQILIRLGRFVSAT